MSYKQDSLLLSCKFIDKVINFFKQYIMMSYPSEILSGEPEQKLDLNIFHVMLNRRSQRSFLDKEVNDGR
ncbi:MAG: hypothetical protein KatS3mg003_2090 [Candidatus Nitrosocaldaceae archaeon]|nr:MAG: hypothetical protein KatS3mg003_2090 [Candidatus Nitrosocaldaceae archaeon]